MKYASLIATQVINPSFHLVLAIILINQYSDEIYAEFVIQYALLMGLSAIVQKSKWQHVHYFLSLGDQKNENYEILKNELSWIMKMTPILFCVLFFVNFTLPDPLFEELILITLIYFTSLFVFNGLAVGYLRFKERYFEYLLFLFFSSALKLLGITLGWNETFGSVIYFICTVDLLTWLPVVMYSSFKIKGLDYKLSKDALSVAEIEQHQTGQYWSALLVLPLQQFDKVGLAYLLSPANIALYSVIQKTTLLFAFIIEPLYVLKMREKNKKLLEGYKLFSFKDLFKMFSLPLFLQFPILMLLLFVPQVYFESILGLSINFWTYSFYFISFVIGSSLYFIHVYGVKYLPGKDFLLSTALSVAIYIITVIPMTYAFGLIGALISLSIQFFTILLFRLYPLMLRGVF
tara:strand:- start:7747 stop:8958 length:1212 start_codon:yes stop_codon:yes gene_type:complete